MRAESTPGARGPVFCGVDTHADSHWLCVLDWRGRKVLSRQFPADAAGYEALAGAIAAAGEPACVAMEGTSSYGAGLTRRGSRSIGTGRPSRPSAKWILKNTLPNRSVRPETPPFVAPKEQNGGVSLVEDVFRG